MSSRPSWRRAASVLASVLVLGASQVGSVHAQDPIPVQVTIAPVGRDGISGVALLSPASGGTSIQILVSGAPPETFAVIHAGTCEPLDPTPVALIGDVSGTSQVTVPNAFDALADGGHVLALHAGLDLVTAVGCGAIPADATVPQPDPNGTFSGPLTGVRVTWSPDWERYEVVTVDGEDRVGLRNGSSTLLLAARLAPGGDPQDCVRDARQDLFDRLDAGTLRDLEPLTDAQGAVISGVETGRAWLAYRYLDIGANGEADITDHLECRQAGDILLHVLHRSFTEDYARATEARERLLADVTFPTTPAPLPTPVADGGSYTAPTVGFTLTWDDRWTAVPVQGLEAYEHIGLSDGPSRVVVSGVIDARWDALACAMDSDANFQVRASTGSMTDLTPLTGPDGTRVQGGDASRAWTGYRYTDAATGGTVAEYHECRAAGAVVVRIQHRSLPEVYDEEAVAREALLLGLTMPSAPPPTPAPAPTQDAACDGYQAWHDSTSGRFDELARLRSEETQGVDELSRFGDLPTYQALLRRIVTDVARLHLAQQAQSAPPAARDAQALAVTMFERFWSAATIQSAYYETSTDLFTLERMQRAQQAAQRAQRDFEDALVAVEAVCG